LVAYGGLGEFHELTFSNLPSKRILMPVVVEDGLVDIATGIDGIVVIGFTAGPEKRIVQVTSNLFHLGKYLLNVL